MSAPSRRTVIVRLGQFLLLVGWVWSLVGTVHGPYTALVRLPDGGVMIRPVTVGDPLPWFRYACPDPSTESLYRFVASIPAPIGCAGRPLRSWSVTDPFAPAAGLLLALCLPPLILDKLTNPRGWNSWHLVAVAAGTGGFAAAFVRAVVFDWIDCGLVGTVAMVLRDYAPIVSAHRTLFELQQGEWGPLLPPATLCGLSVCGLTTAGILRPWLPRPSEVSR